MKLIMTLVFLLYGSYMDFRFQCISKRYLSIFGSFAVIDYFLVQRDSFLQFDVVYQLLYSLLPGIITLIIGRVTKEEIGYGDGFILIILGLLLGWKELLLMITFSLLIVMFVSICIFPFRNKFKFRTMPLIPFLLISFLIIAV